MILIFTETSETGFFLSADITIFRTDEQWCLSVMVLEVFMYQGKSLVELARELERVKNEAKDYSVPTDKMHMNSEGKIQFQNGSVQALELNDWSSNQVASYTDIPREYFNRLRNQSPDLLAKNVNHGFEKANPGKEDRRMIRAFDGKVRAFLSTKYRRLDSYELLNETLPTLSDNKFEVISSELTERRLYVKAITPKLTADVKVGDAVQFGIVLSNSDVGAGSLRVEPLIYRLVCANGAIMSTAFRKYHVGRNQGGDDVEELLSDKTKALGDAAFFAAVRDILISSMKPEIFEREVNKMREAANRMITKPDLEQVVELSMSATRVSGDKTKNNILRALASGNEGAGLTQWGLANSFTRAAQAEGIDYESATELEKAGGQIIELDKQQWKRIAEAV